MVILMAYEELQKNFKVMYFQLRPFKDCQDDLVVVHEGEGDEQFKPRFELFQTSIHYNESINFYGKQDEELSSKEFAFANSIVELINEIGDAIPCKLIL